MTLTGPPTAPSTVAGAVPSQDAPRSSSGHAGARARVEQWVAQVAALTDPDAVEWVDGSAEGRQRLIDLMVGRGTLIALNPQLRPGSYLARSDPADVARVEDRTFICSPEQDDAGPTNNWREPEAMRAELRSVFAGSMRGRTMYVVPFSMGPVGGPISQIGVQLTDSPYVVVSMEIMTRVGDAVLGELERTSGFFVPALHSVGAPLRPDDVDVPWPCSTTKYIVQFPQTREIWSYGSGYGGNALLGKKCFALRIASVMGRDEGWLAEHMLVLKVTNPAGRVFHLTAAFPSSCGKSNLAMLRPTVPGWTVETIGDDIAWLRPGPDGRLRAINPEAGFFGVAPGTGESTNPTAIATLTRDVIFTNVALTDDGDVWWEGLTPTPPPHLIDWRGQDWAPGCGRLAAHPNSRFTVAADQCPSIADDWQAPQGVAVDAIWFGGRRAHNVPLVLAARDWAHGVFLGATVASEQTAAAEGPLGVLRRDPFAMLPFCGYNMADYWGHWLELGAMLSARGAPLPAVFGVNWFRRGSDGSFLWPGYSENSRVLAWALGLLDGSVQGVDSPVGVLPAPGELDLTGLDLPDGAYDELMAVDPDAWLAECDLTDDYFARFGDRVPDELHEQLATLRSRLTAARRE